MGMDRVLVGRDAECAALRRALAAGRRPRPPVILVAGEAGAGKTALVEHVLARTGTPALPGRATEWAGTAYDVLGRALRPAIRDTAGPVPRVLAKIIPERGAPPAEPDLTALAVAVGSVLASLADGGPLALFLDDLQWADQATLSLLPALADALCDVPVTLIGCYRSDELPRDHRLRAARAQLRRSRQLTEIDVGPLGDQDVFGMLTQLLGAKPEAALAATVAAWPSGTAWSRWPAGTPPWYPTASGRPCCCGRPGCPARNAGCSRRPRWRARSSTSTRCWRCAACPRGRTDSPTLFISPRTVDMHVQGSLLKLGCRTRAEAIRRLAELGTLPPEASAR